MSGTPGDVPGEPARRRPALSPSRAADFKQCPLLYRFRAIDRLPEPPSTAQVRGSVVHAALEQLYGLPAAQRGPQTVDALVGPAWEQVIAGEPELVRRVVEAAGDGATVAATTGATGAASDGAHAAVAAGLVDRLQQAT